MQLHERMTCDKKHEILYAILYTGVENGQHGQHDNSVEQKCCVRPDRDPLIRTTTFIRLQWDSEQGFLFFVFCFPNKVSIVNCDFLSHFCTQLNVQVLVTGACHHDRGYQIYQQYVTWLWKNQSSPDVYELQSKGLEDQLQVSELDLHFPPISIL